VHSYLTKSKTYQGLDLFWKPEEVLADSSGSNGGFFERNYLTYSGAAATTSFGVCVPLKSIFSFCNDYDKVMWGLKQRVRMTNSTKALYRVNANNNATGSFPAISAAANNAVVNISTLRWIMPVVRPSPSHEQALLEIVGNNSQFIDVTIQINELILLLFQLQLHSLGH